VLILGAAYKRDVDDPRESPFFTIAEQLIDLGAILSYSDPHILQLPKMRAHNLPPMESQPLTAAYVAAQDCVLIVTDHSAFDYSFIASHAQLIVDTRNTIRDIPEANNKLVRA
jgi:UDP-N-acetyl-D-glucosamine dehydrogenase